MDRGVISSINVTQEMKMPANAEALWLPIVARSVPSVTSLVIQNAAEWERGSSRSRRKASGSLIEG